MLSIHLDRMNGRRRPSNSTQHSIRLCPLTSPSKEMVCLPACVCLAGHCLSLRLSVCASLFFYFLPALIPSQIPLFRQFINYIYMYICGVSDCILNEKNIIITYIISFLHYFIQWYPHFLSLIPSAVFS